MFCPTKHEISPEIVKELIGQFLMSKSVMFKEEMSSISIFVSAKSKHDIFVFTATSSTDNDVEETFNFSITRLLDKFILYILEQPARLRFLIDVLTAILIAERAVFDAFSTSRAVLYPSARAEIALLSATLRSLSLVF